MKVILDTNIFISGIFWTGKCNNLINYWKKEEFKLVTSLEIIDEFIRILKDFKIQLPEEIIKEWVELIIRNSIIVEPKEKFDVIKLDHKDDMFLDAAIAGNADYIVSQDNHLLNLREFKEIKIITPEEFLNILSKSKN